MKTMIIKRNFVTAIFAHKNRIRFLLGTLLMHVISFNVLRSMNDTQMPTNFFDLLPAELHQKILFEQDPILLQNAIDFMGQQPITIAENFDVKSVIILNDKIITRTSHHPTTLIGSIKIWDARTGEHIHTLVDANEYCDKPHSLAAHNNKIAAGFMHWTIQIWDAESYACLKTIQEEIPQNYHDSRVTHLAIQDNNIIAGADDTVKIFDMESGECIQAFQATDLVLNALATNDSMICTGSPDNLVKIWDYTGACLHTFNGFKNSFSGALLAIAIDEDAIGAITHTIGKVWNIKEKSCIFKFVNWRYPGYLRTIQLNNGKIIVGSDDTMVKIMNLTNGAIHNLAGPKKHTGSTYTVDMQNTIAVTGSQDHTAKIWPLITNLNGTADTNPLIWIIQKSNPLQVNFIKRAYENSQAGQECIIALPDDLNHVKENESPAQRDGRIYFSIPLVIRTYLRDHLTIRK